MFQVTCLDACDPLTVVDDFSPWLDERVKDYVSVEVDDRDASQSVSLLR